MARVGVGIEAGSGFEAPETNGTAHFLEHMFKGTTRWPTARARERTAFFADVLANILQHSRLTRQAICLERDTIPREMKEVVSAAGDVNHQEVVDHVSEMFTGFSTDPTTADQLVKINPASFTGSEDRKCRDATSTPCNSFQGVIMYQPSFYSVYGDTALVAILEREHQDGRPDNLHHLSTGEFRRLAYSLSEAEVARARNQLKSSVLLDMNRSLGVAESNAYQMLSYRRIVLVPEMLARIDAVDCDTIMETANEFIIDKDIAIAAAGPLSKLPKLSWFHSQIQT